MASYVYSHTLHTCIPGAVAAGEAVAAVAVAVAADEADAVEAAAADAAHEKWEKETAAAQSRTVCCSVLQCVAVNCSVLPYVYIYIYIYICIHT